MDFAGMIETWRRVLTQPGEPVFEQEKVNPNGTLQTALIWMLIAGVIAAIFGLIAGAIGASSAAAMISQMGIPPEMRGQVGSVLGLVTGGAGFGAIIAVPLGFLIGTFIIHLIAKMLGGQGDYGKYAYLSSTFQAPLTIISSILSIIPFLGGCIGFLLIIYTYVEAYFAVKVNYGLTSGRAIAAILIPLAIVFLILICLVVLVGGVLAGLSGNS
jgi:hypothetical protein